jgi:thymidylate synthase (FAD)|tara:strand:+ start:42375 stop:43049 length:675 start_codon:yes stop_codon:yes gene_type:complete
MKVKLMGYTQPVEGDFIGLNDVQDLIAYCARVSNPANQINSQTTEKLLGYLAKHKHWSPFEMASATMEVETTRDIARQMLRHRSFAFQEFSQRYANPQDMSEAFVLREARMQDTKNRQNSIDTSDRMLQRNWEIKQQMVINASKEAYDWAINNGIAKEQARSVLPEGNTVSRLYMQGSIRSWIHFVELRSGNGTQKEHIEVARAIGEAIVGIFPLCEKFIERTD